MHQESDLGASRTPDGLQGRSAGGLPRGRAPTARRRGLTLLRAWTYRTSGAGARSASAALVRQPHEHAEPDDLETRPTPTGPRHWSSPVRLGFPGSRRPPFPPDVPDALLTRPRGSEPARRAHGPQGHPRRPRSGPQREGVALSEVSHRRLHEVPLGRVLHQPRRLRATAVHNVRRSFVSKRVAGEGALGGIGLSFSATLPGSGYLQDVAREEQGESPPLPPEAHMSYLFEKRSEGIRPPPTSRTSETKTSRAVPGRVELSQEAFPRRGGLSVLEVWRARLGGARAQRLGSSLLSRSSGRGA